jgi:ferredoxin
LALWGGNDEEAKPAQRRALADSLVNWVHDDANRKVLLTRRGSMSFTVTVESSGEQFHCDADTNVLAAMEHACCHGIPVGCRNGGCGACKVRITAGRYVTKKMNRAVVSAEEEARGCVLACKTYPQSDLSVNVLGRTWRAVTEHGGAAFSFTFTTTAQVSQPDKET